MLAVVDTALVIVKELLLCISVAIIFVASAAGWTLRH